MEMKLIGNSKVRYEIVNLLLFVSAWVFGYGLKFAYKIFWLDALDLEKKNSTRMPKPWCKVLRVKQTYQLIPCLEEMSSRKCNLWSTKPCVSSLISSVCFQQWNLWGASSPVREGCYELIRFVAAKVLVSCKDKYFRFISGFSVVAACIRMDNDHTMRLFWLPDKNMLCRWTRIMVPMKDSFHVWDLQLGLKPLNYFCKNKSAYSCSNKIKCCICLHASK